MISSLIELNINDTMNLLKFAEKQISPLLNVKLKQIVREFLYVHLPLPYQKKNRALKFFKF